MKQFLAVCVVSILAATNSSAATIRWTLDGVIGFADGTGDLGSFYEGVGGSFDVDVFERDDGPNVVLSVNASNLDVVCGGTMCQGEFSVVTAFGNPLLLQVTGTDDNGDALRFDMHFLEPVNSIGSGIVEVDYAVFVNLDAEFFRIVDEPFTVSASAVPVPAAAWLFGSALAGLGWLRRKPIG